MRPNNSQLVGGDRDSLSRIYASRWMLVQARPPSALYYAVPGDLCDRSVSVCSWIPASNNHSDPFPRRLPSLVQLPASQSSRTSWLGRKTARRVPEENRSRGDATTRSALRDFVACVEAARGAGGGAIIDDPPTTTNRNKFHTDHATNDVSIRPIFIELSPSLLPVFAG